MSRYSFWECDFRFVLWILVSEVGKINVFVRELKFVIRSISVSCQFWKQYESDGGLGFPFFQIHSQLFLPLQNVKLFKNAKERDRWVFIVSFPKLSMCRFSFLISVTRIYQTCMRSSTRFNNWKKRTSVTASRPKSASFTLNYFYDNYHRYFTVTLPLARNYLCSSSLRLNSFKEMNFQRSSLSWIISR